LKKVPAPNTSGGGGNVGCAGGDDGGAEGDGHEGGGCTGGEVREQL